MRSLVPTPQRLRVCGHEGLGPRPPRALGRRHTCLEHGPRVGVKPAHAEMEAQEGSGHRPRGRAQEVPGGRLSLAGARGGGGGLVRPDWTTGCWRGPGGVGGPWGCQERPGGCWDQGVLGAPGGVGGPQTCWGGLGGSRMCWGTPEAVRRRPREVSGEARGGCWGPQGCQGGLRGASRGVRGPGGVGSPRAVERKPQEVSGEALGGVRGSQGVSGGP